MRLLNKMMLAVFFAWSSYAMAVDSVEISNKINECNQLVKSENPQKALDLSSQLIHLNPSSRDVFLCKGRAEVALSQYKQAIESFKTVGRLSSTDMERMMASAMLGNAYKANNQTQEAIVQYKAALETSKSLKNQGLERVSHELIASALFLATKYDEAIAEYQIALKLAQNDGERADIYERTAEAYEKLNKRDAAIEYQVKASLAHTKYSDIDKQVNAQLELARMYIESDLYDQAGKVIEKVLAVTKDASPYWEAKCYIYMAKLKLAFHQNDKANDYVALAGKLNEPLQDKDLSELLQNLSKQLAK
jgi:tetratricopeptide (TPR) repeat protein